MTVDGVVRSWNDELGWGVLDAEQTPGGCWVHLSAVAVPGFRELSPGQAVEFEFERSEQDGYPFRATRVWPAAGQPGAPPRSSAYRSALTITFDDPSSGQPGLGHRDAGGQ